MIRCRGVTIDRDRRMISHRGETLCLPPILFRLISALLLAGPLSKQALFDHIYDHREDGGPLSGLRALDVMLVTVRKKLAAIGLEIRTDGPWNFHHKRYWAEPVRQSVLLEAAE